MSEPTPPGQEHVPDHVLSELSDAFAEESVPQYDFDDPSIDRLLGITDEHAAAQAGDDPDDLDDEQYVDLDDDDLDGDDLDGDDLDGDLAAPGTPEPPEPPEPPAAAPHAPAAPSAVPAPRRVIVIAEDDRPDSVYLDEDKEKAFHERRDAVDESGARSTIVIADLDEAGSSQPPLARSRDGGIDPRIRARRISVRRAEGRRRLIWAGIGIGVVLVAVGAIAVFASSIFDVREVSVQGAVYTDKDVLDAVIADLRGEPVLLVDTTAAEKRLEAVPWVESARVATDFPHRVVIDIRERRPVAAFQGGDQQFRIIDAQGRVLDVITGQPVDYMLITGNHPDTARGQFAGAPYAATAELVLSLPAEISGITRSVGVDAATGTLTMVLESGSPDGVAVRLGDSQNLDEKLARLLKQVRSGLDGVCQLDVSTSDAGVVPC
ncbi:MAG: FtsQ-type POTRA domain-containing protein [Ilumatobacteraceae bacterium]